MKKISYIFKHNSMLSVSTFVSLCYIIFYVVYNNAPQVIPFGDVLFEILFQLSMGIIVSWIFYIVVVLTPEYNRRVIIRKSIDQFYSEIFIYRDQLAEQINKCLSGDGKINVDNITIFCKITNINMSSGVCVGSPINPEMTWKEYLIFIIDKNIGTINKIFNSFAHLIDTEELVLLNRLLKCKLFEERTFISYFDTLQQQNIELFTISLINYFELTDNMYVFNKKQLYDAK